MALSNITPEYLELLRQLQEGAAPPPAAPPPEPIEVRKDPAASYNERAAGYNTQADALDKQAASAYPQPEGANQRIVQGIRAAMENFGRYGAPGGYYGQEAARQKTFTDNNAALAKRAQELRNQSADQQRLAQNATSQENTFSNQNRDYELRKTSETRLQDQSDRPTHASMAPGNVGISIDKNGMEVPGSRITVDQKPGTMRNPGYRDVTLPDQSVERRYFEQGDPGVVVYKENLGKPADRLVGGSEGRNAMGQTTDENGNPILVTVNRQNSTARPVTMQGDASKTPLATNAQGNASVKANSTVKVDYVNAQRLFNTMNDTLTRIKSGQSKAVGADDMVLLSNHIAMTMGSVKGARTGRDLIEAHKDAISADQKLSRAVNSVMNGGQLTPEQREEFVNLAKRRVDEMRRSQTDMQDAFGSQSAATAPAAGGSLVKPGGAVERLLNGR